MKFKGRVQHYPRRALMLKPDVPGAKMWSVALENTMLTYFEINPHSSFKAHSHQSEQITMFLEGVLFFTVNERLICLKRGEVLAIPSRVPHAAFTRRRLVRAVDAWSPVMNRYRG